MTKVFLIGFMAVGKTTIGKRLANSLGISFVDLDSEIVQRESRSINEIFEQEGESYFRKLESEILSEFCQGGQEMILSTGGGAPIHANNLERMLASGTVVWLDMDREMILNRLLQSTKRPLVKDKSEDELRDFVSNHIEERIPFYQKAHFRFQSGNLTSERLAELVELVQTR
ncbi:MAG: shikimate kinase [Flavobacteriales bacterium]|nr:shikimate kinase [Flavobacteriales bacterium]